jgi:hypothetical protein
MFLFPAETSRVLADDGVLLWVSTNGEETPIYLPPADVLDAIASDGVPTVTSLTTKPWNGTR